MVKITKISGNVFASNVYLVESKKTNFLVDTGMRNSERILQKIEEKGLEIDSIILTHRHYDHVGNVKVLSEKLNISVYAHESAAKALRIGDNETIISRSFGVNMPKLKVHSLEEKELSKFEIIKTPGHSECSISIYHPEEKILFSGDTIFANGGIGRTDLPTGNFNELKSSLELLGRMDVKSLYPGHGPSVEDEGNKHVKMSLQNISYL